jgi:hypothetical protein
MRFSVGKISIEGETIAKCTGITVRFDGNPVDFYGAGQQDPLEIQLGNKATTITVEYGEWDVDDVASILSDSYVDIELLASDYDANRGITGLTLNRCKATSWEITSSQNGFITYRLELRKSYST